MRNFIFIFFIIFSFVSCTEGQKKRINEPQPVYTYTVINKSTEVGSHYNILTDKQVVGTEYVVVFKSKNGKINAEHVSMNDYYTYEVGKTYNFKRPFDYRNY